MKKLDVKLNTEAGHAPQVFECSSAEDLTRACYDWLLAAIKNTGAKRVFFPAGSTPISLYSHMEEKGVSAFKGVTFVQVDDVVTGSQNGVFKRFFEKYLPSFTSQFEWVPEDSEKALGADIAVLGIGLNGHVAFHEPHMSVDFSFGTVDLCETTVKNLKLEPKARGRSYGLAHFMKCKKVLVISRGISKALITAEMLGAKKGLPSSQFLYHPDFTLIADEEALSLVGKNGCPGVEICGSIENEIKNFC